MALWQCDQLVDRILAECDATEWTIFISGENNWRYQLYPDYKIHRRNKPRPRHLEAVRGHLVSEWNAEITDGIEADDALGIAAVGGTIVASIDKDLLQIPGEHYHFVKREFCNVSVLDGWRNFYTQVLVGDTSDSVPGCPGIGKVKGPRLVEFAQSPEEMFDICSRAYAKVREPFQNLIRNAMLLYVQRKEGDQWTPPLSTQATTSQSPAPAAS